MFVKSNQEKTALKGGNGREKADRERGEKEPRDSQTKENKTESAAILSNVKQ
jgi:hypothetical protein